MKKTRSWLIALLILPLLLTSIPAQKANAQDVVVSYQTFYDQLAPYGQWVYDPEYGNVWVPNVAPGFRPYATDGHWVLTDEGNMWVSDEPWGWAAYHYGRWTYNPYYGWVWIPGYEWAPAWVTWRYGSGYYGWAPMGPGYEFGRHHHYDYPDNYWVFVSPDYLYHPTVYNYYERGDVSVYVRRTDYIRYEDRGSNGYGGGRGYYYGPRREDIERETHRPVDVYRVSNAREVSGGGVGDHQINIYRPAVNRESVNSARPSGVIQGNDHPIGRPAPISNNHETVQPTFRQEHPQQQQYQQQQQHQQQQYQQQPPHVEQQQPPHQQQQYQQQPPHVEQQQPPRQQQQQYQQQPPHVQQQQPPHVEQQQPPHQQQQQYQQPPRVQQQQYQQPPRVQQQQPPRQQQPPKQQPKPQPQQEKKH